MNRTIRFRAWDIGEKKWINPKNLSLYVTTDNHNISLEVGGTGSGIIFQEFTGFKDKDGKEIFEGDIVKVYWHLGLSERIDFKKGKEKICEVTFANGCFWCKTKYLKGLCSQLYNCKVELVGNIFKNPEILEERA